MKLDYRMHVNACHQAADSIKAHACRYMEHGCGSTSLTGKGDEDKGTILQSVEGIRVKLLHINHAAISVSFVCTPSCDPPSGASCSTIPDLRRDHHRR